MADASECRLDDDEDDDASVHSAISNASDFEEDEEVDYLALELVQYLPADKVTKLCKNMRTKEKAVQDLLHRNKSLLESCQKLDEENQALSEQLKAAAEEKPKTAAQPPSQPAAAPVVDSSVFLKLERGKEEQILILRSENERLKVQVRRLNDCGQQLEDALAEARKELKKVQQGGRQEPRSNKGGAGLDRKVLDEEERIYRELQGETTADLITKKMQDRQAENRAKVQSVLQALLSDDLQRIKHWSSDVAAIMLAVEGTEALLKHGPKEPKDTRDPKDPKVQKRGKETAGGGDLRAGGEPGVPDAVFAELREVRGMGKHLIANLEEGGKALSERTDKVIAAMYGESSVVSGDKARSAANPSAASGTAEEARVAAPEAKRRRARRKGRAEPEPPAGSAGGGATGSTAAAAPAAEGEGSGRPDASEELPARTRGEVDEDSQLRADFHEVFRDGEEEARSGRAGGSTETHSAVLAGPGLLQELQSLRSDAEALEARLAERLRARSEAAEGGEAQGGSAAKPKAQRRKKMYA